MTPATTLDLDYGTSIHVHDSGGDPAQPIVCAMHPAESFGVDTVELLAAMTGARVVCIGWGEPSLLDSIPAMSEFADVCESVRSALAIPKWCFWGMSGGGWIAQSYALQYPASLTGIVVESVCACFRARLLDPACVLSPAHPMWGDRLQGLELPAPGPGNLAWLELEGGTTIVGERGEPVLVSPAPLSAGMRKAMPMMLAFDARGWLDRIGTKALVIAGAEDPIAPLGQVRAVADAIPGAQWLAVEGAGHVPTATRHPAVEAAVRPWLAG